jgi:hypothetical protein
VRYHTLRLGYGFWSVVGSYKHGKSEEEGMGRRGGLSGGKWGTRWGKAVTGPRASATRSEFLIASQSS